MEEELLKWIVSQRDKKLSVKMADIKEKSKQLMKSMEPNTIFQASNGWFCRFIQITHLSRRTQRTL